MAQRHPIDPPPELVQQWDDEGTAMFRPEYQMRIATRAAQWGADQELEACLEWLDENLPGYDACEGSLRSARRPKPQSLKEQALQVFDKLEHLFDGYGHDGATIRRALEQLP